MAMFDDAGAIADLLADPEPDPIPDVSPEPEPEVDAAPVEDVAPEPEPEAEPDVPEVEVSADPAAPTEGHNVSYEEYSKLHKLYESRGLEMRGLTDSVAGMEAQQKAFMQRFGQTPAPPAEAQLPAVAADWWSGVLNDEYSSDAEKNYARHAQSQSKQMTQMRVDMWMDGKHREIASAVAANPNVSAQMLWAAIGENENLNVAQHAQRQSVAIDSYRQGIVADHYRSLGQTPPSPAPSAAVAAGTSSPAAAAPSATPRPSSSGARVRPAVPGGGKHLKTFEEADAAALKDFELIFST